MGDKPDLKALAEAATPGPWELWTSCSFRRITQRGGQDGGVLSGDAHPIDGHLDLRATEATLEYIAACSPEVILTLLAERDALRKDAERYLWLRAFDSDWRSAGLAGHVSTDKIRFRLHGPRLDAAIDAAMEQPK